MHVSPRWFAALLAFASTIAWSPAGADKPVRSAELLGPADLLKLTAESPVHYTWKRLDELVGGGAADLARRMWPSEGPSRERPWVTTGDGGSRMVTDYVLEPECLTLIADGQAAAAVERYRRCYPALLALGRIREGEGRVEQALEEYRKAALLNPYDYRVHALPASALARAGRRAEALPRYARALALAPHRPELLEVLAEDGFDVQEISLTPRALTRKEGDSIVGYFNLEEAHWFVYGLCKAVWLGEPEFRIERTGAREPGWSIMEETQCLLSLLHSYQGLRDDERIPAEPAIERMGQAFESTLFRGFVLYEIGYRISGDLTLALPESALEDVVGYVESFVLAE